MPVFEYTGVDRNRKKANGVIEADGEKAARQKLRKMGIYPQSLTMAGAKQKVSLSSNIDFGSFFQKVKTQDVAQMTRQLASLLNAGIPLVEAFTALVDQMEHPKLKKILSQIREKVTEGSKLSDAMRPHSAVFSDLYINMVNAGENSGALDVVLGRLADFTESQSKLQSKVKGAMMYPLIMSVVGTLLIILLMVGVVPKIVEIIKDQGQALPLPTKIVIFISDLFSSGWFLAGFFLAIPGLMFLFKRWKNTERGRLRWDGWMLRAPLFGNLTRKVAISRFSRTLSTLLASGVPMLQAMEIVRTIVDNMIIRNAIEETAASVREGASVADPLKKSGQFPPIVTHMVAIGERTGELEKMLERVADTYDTQVDNTVSALTTLLEPMMILVMASIVGFIVMAVLLPILQMGENI